MKKIMDIELPLRKTHRLHGSDQVMLDVLFDMKVPDMNTLLARLSKSGTPALIVIKVGELNIIMVLMYLPPDIWLDFDNQKYQVFIAPSVEMVIHYFVDRRMRTHDSLELSILTKMIEFLQSYITNQQRVSHTW
ncbi:MAG: hypothetical protein DRI97_17020 [Bacteroidetes bacterium]|nr:MAG: hypothetical protein DRI97_17020 [Bacteroidota bacterium]